MKKLADRPFTDKEQKIETLLSWWMDVLEGWKENGRGSDDFGLKMMSRAWNSRAYRELHRCLLALRDENNRVYWHVRERYQAGKRTVLACPRCDKVSEVAAKHFAVKRGVRHVTLKHKHAGDTVFFVLRSVPAVSAAVDDAVVAEGVRWLAARFDGEVFIPADLLVKTEEDRAA